MLYPAYSSYKAIKTKDVREYVRWMMYWIVFAIFMTAETFADIFISWFPFYYELKMAFVIWLLSPYTKGASLLYRKFVHPALSSKEKEIDHYIIKAKESSYETMVTFGKKGLNMAAMAAVQAVTKSQGVIAGRLRSFTMQDLRNIPADDAVQYTDPLYPDTLALQRRPIAVARREFPGTSRPSKLSREDSDSQEDYRSDSEVSKTKSSTVPKETQGTKPLRRSQSLRAVKKKAPAKEGTSRAARPKIKRKPPQSDTDTL
nr:PREDICTED: receptor expression-enhancing protein 4-like isoform X2 [Latimeria chalumnae]XP_014341530.1 PREDICTED: receptor expression-enhancing protein 4-like isoform X2 [Latimeria chalumnae]|eukprot:XP_005991953.1 PREDICTED: receptor expression-enhancing protein 4-like isoform X2 [Latimeria chalumnae]